MIPKIEETEEEMSSRRLLEEVQRTFIHLDEGSRGRCFDPRSLVEASGCLELEFDTMEAYSYSVPDTILKKKNAIDEFGQRNGLLLSIEAENEKEKEEEGDESFGTFIYTAAGAVLSSSLRR